MSVLDDFNRFAFERAKAKYDRAQFDQMSHDDWAALVEGYKGEASSLQVEVEQLRADLDACG